jgi:hypothetical protein
LHSSTDGCKKRQQVLKIVLQLSNVLLCHAQQHIGQLDKNRAKMPGINKMKVFYFGLYL